jgi:glycosyltransferase involved in cell wall biosynthesis
MEGNIKISIIIPTYNSEKFLRAALESVENQTFKSFEVIVSDDGSTDGSFTIAEEFCKKRENWFLIKNTHAGPGSARNAGIKIARGEFISFIDSDDSISPFFLEKLYCIAKKSGSDIAACAIMFNFTRFWIKIPDIMRLSSGVYKHEKILANLVSDVRIHFYLSNKIFKKSLFTENGIEIPDMIFEDIVAVLQLFYHANRVAVTNEPLYIYNRRNDSLIGDKLNKNGLADLGKALSFIRSFLESKGIFKKYTLRYFFLVIRACFVHKTFEFLKLLKQI